MSDPISFVIGGAILGAVLGSRKQEEQQAPPPPEPVPIAEAPAIAAAPTAAKAAEEANKAGLEAQRRQREAAAAAVGRSDTLLTGPMGLGNSAAQAGVGSVKTLLGM